MEGSRHTFYHLSSNYCISQQAGRVRSQKIAVLLWRQTAAGRKGGRAGGKQEWKTFILFGLRKDTSVSLWHVLPGASLLRKSLGLNFYWQHNFPTEIRRQENMCRLSHHIRGSGVSCSDLLCCLNFSHTCRAGPWTHFLECSQQLCKICLACWVRVLSRSRGFLWLFCTA